MDYQSLYSLYYKSVQNPEAWEQEYQNRFNSPFSQHLGIQIHQIDRHKTYELFYVLTPEMAVLQDQIMSAYMSLARLTNEMPPVGIMQFLFTCLISEIKSTNDIEGVRSSRKEIREALVMQEHPEDSVRLWGIVNKYAKIIYDEDIPLDTCKDIRQLYDTFILDEIKRDDPHNLPDSELFRADSVSIVSAAQKSIHEGLSPESQIIDYMEKSLHLLHDPQFPMFFRIAIFHYLFGYIHPFYDGNGRMSRFITSYLLAKNLHPTVALRLSVLIKKNKTKYYELFEHTTSEWNEGDLTPFITASLRLILYSIKDTQRLLHQKLFQYKKLDTVLQQYPFKDLTTYGIYNVLLQASVFSWLGATIEQISEPLHKTSRTIYSRVTSLPPEDILVEKTSRPYHYRLSLRFMRTLIDQSNQKA